MSQDVDVRIEDGIAWISMDDGKVNALSEGLLGQLSAALQVAEEGEAVVVLTGRRGIFSAGFDMKTFAAGAEPSARMVQAGARVIDQLLAFPFPVLCAAAGHAYPMGAFLMLSSDVRFAEAGAWQFGMNEVAIGITVPHFALELARHRLTPPGFASVTTGSMFEAEDALRWGYVDQIVPADLYEPAIEKEAHRLRALDMPAYAATKLRINDAARKAIQRGIELDLEMFRSM